jgi:hypothetical protein
MTQMQMYVEIKGTGEAVAMVQRAIAHVAQTIGDAMIVDHLVGDQDCEADVAVVSSVDAALRAFKETEKTRIIIAYFSEEEMGPAQALATRYPGRISARGLNGEDNLVICFLRLLSESAKEVTG